VNNELDTRRRIGEEPLDGVGVPDLEVDAAKRLRVGGQQPLGLGPCRSRLAEERCAHVVLDPDDVEPRLGELGH
jgi:hypothetical protein